MVNRKNAGKYSLQLSESVSKKKFGADNLLNLNRDNFSHFVLPQG